MWPQETQQRGTDGLVLKLQSKHSFGFVFLTFLLECVVVLQCCVGEGNGNPLQCSCLENPRDRRAWWATVCRVTRVGHDLVTKPPPSVVLVSAIQKSKLPIHIHISLLGHYGALSRAHCAIEEHITTLLKQRNILIIYLFYIQYCIYIYISKFSCSVLSNSLQPYESQHARPPCPSPTPGVHSHSRPSSQ